MPMVFSVCGKAMGQHELNQLTALANAAFEQAAAKVVERARQTGTPIVVWADDHVSEVSPEQIAKDQPRNTPNTRKTKAE